MVIIYRPRIFNNKKLWNQDKALPGAMSNIDLKVKDPVLCSIDAKCRLKTTAYEYGLEVIYKKC